MKRATNPVPQDEAIPSETVGPRELFSLNPLARRFFLLGVGLSALASLALIAWTLSLAYGISAVIEHRSLLTPAIGLVAFLAVRVTARFTSSRALAKASSLLQTAVRDRLVRSWVDGQSEASKNGSRTTLLGPGIDSLGEYLSAFLPARLLAGGIPVVVLLVIAYFDRWTLLILLFAGPMLLLLLAVIGGRTSALADRRFRELGWLRTFYVDMVRGIPTLKVFHRANESVNTIEELSSRLGRTTMDVLRTAFQTSLVIEWAATAATALVAVQVSFRMIEGEIGYSIALAVLTLTPEFFAPLRTLAVEYHAGQTGNAVLEQLSECRMFGDQLDFDATDQRPSTELGTISFNSVSFRYPDEQVFAVKHFDLTIKPGETVAVVGPSGSGKSTLAKLLMGQLRPTEGAITANNINIETWDHDKWLSLITSVPQKPFLFRSSVRDNITLSNRNASEAEIAEALSLSVAAEFVSALPDGLETLVGEDGSTLSGGQRQRLALARAVLRQAPLVVLDEFTAHLDPITEAKVIESLRPLLAGRTVLMIAHREATLTLADRVITLSAPQRTEVG